MTTPDTTPAAPVRLIIGKHEMSGFAGLSDGDRFGHLDGHVYIVRNSTYGITLRREGGSVSDTLEGFVDLPDYFAFVHAVNAAFTA